MRTADLFAWMLERYNVLLNKTANKPKPWTEDPILQAFRFCNVYREMDAETIWIHRNWLDPHTDDPNVFFAMVVARLINWHESLEEFGYPAKWNPSRFLKVMQGRQRRGDKTFSGAYIVSTNGKPGDKLEYLVEYVLNPLWKDRKNATPRKGELLSEYHTRLRDYQGMGSFMAAQVIADVKHAHGGPLHKAKDFWTFAASGPGSRRGLNRVMGHDKLDRWREDAWRLALSNLHDVVTPLVDRHGMPRLDAQNLQSCLCEFDKYERVRLGEGRPRSTYPGKV